jgi:hypothetical protein
VLGGPAKTVMLAGENLGAATGAVLLDRNGNAVSGVELTLRAAESATIRALDLTAGAGAIVSSYQLALVVPGLPSPPRVETPVTVLVTRAPPRTLEFSTEVMTMTGLGYDNLVLPFTTEAMTMTGLGYDNVVLEFTIEAMTMTGLGYDNLILEFTTTEMIMTGAEE